MKAMTAAVRASAYRKRRRTIRARLAREARKRLEEAGQLSLDLAGSFHSAVESEEFDLAPSEGLSIVSLGRAARDFGRAE